MKSLPLLLIAGIASLAAAPADPAPARPAPVRPAPVVSGESATGFRFGSAAARTRLTEYGSLNCPHCGVFAMAANPAIIRAVKSGRMLYEYRPIAIFPQDLAAHALAKCVPAGQRLSFIDDYYRNQRGVYANFQRATDDPVKKAALDSALAGSETAAAAALARMGGMIPISARHGLPAPAAGRCLANRIVLKWVGDATRAATAAGVDQTPTFELDGKRTPADAVGAALGLKL